MHCLHTCHVGAADVVANCSARAPKPTSLRHQGLNVKAAKYNKQRITSTGLPEHRRSIITNAAAEEILNPSSSGNGAHSQQVGHCRGSLHSRQRARCYDSSRSMNFVS